MRFFLKDIVFSVISFDMDGVLVSRPITEAPWYNYLVRFVQHRLRTDEEEARRFLLGYDIDGTHRQAQGSVTQAMAQLGIGRIEWNRIKFLEYERLRPIPADPELSSLLESLALKFRIIVVSDNSLDAVLLNLDKLGIDRSIFSYISAFEPSSAHKSDIDRFQPILSALSVDISDVLMIGDKFRSDIEPVIKAGGSGILVDDFRETKTICRMLERPFKNAREIEAMQDFLVSFSALRKV